MAADGTTEIKGLAELQRALDALPANIEKNCLRGALRAAQKVIATIAKNNAPVAPPTQTNAQRYGAYAGALRDSIRIVTSSKNGKIIATVKAGNKKSYYAHWVEYGTAAHKITAINGKALSFGGAARMVINHPGAQQKPFMRPALANGTNAALDQFAAYMRERIDKEQAKLAGPQNF